MTHLVRGRMACRAIRMVMLATAALPILAAPDGQARQYSFHLETCEGGAGSVGRYAAHWDTGICGFEAAYLDDTAHRLVSLHNECDVVGPWPVDDADVDAWVSYAETGPAPWAGRYMAYMTAQGLKLNNADGSAGTAEFVDGGGLVGAENSVAVNAIGSQAVAYRDAARGVLKFAHRGSAGAPWTIEAVDSLGDTGHGASLLFDPVTAVPCMSYVRHVPAPIARDRVVYAVRGSSGWALETAGMFGAGELTHPTSLSMRGNDAWIAVGNGTTGALHVGHRSGGAWTWTTVDSAGAGAWVSLRLDSQGQPHVAYYDAARGDLKFANQDSAGWTIQRVDSIGDTGQYAWLRIDQDYPSISYHDATNGDLRIAYTGGLGGIPGAGTAAGAAALAVRPSPLPAGASAVIELRAGTIPTAPAADIVDASGRLVAHVPLVRGLSGEGRWSARWDATRDGGAPASTGIYFVHVATNRGPAAAKLMVIR